MVVILGVNDTLGFSSPGRWLAALDALLRSVRRRLVAAAVVLAAVPPMQHFPALPSPLRQVLGLRAYVLDLVAIRWAKERPAVVHVPHPSAERSEIPRSSARTAFTPRPWDTSAGAPRSRPRRQRCFAFKVSRLNSER